MPVPLAIFFSATTHSWFCTRLFFTFITFKLTYYLLKSILYFSYSVISFTFWVRTILSHSLSIFDERQGVMYYFFLPNAFKEIHLWVKSRVLTYRFIFGWFLIALLCVHVNDCEQFSLGANLSLVFVKK